MRKIRVAINGLGRIGRAFLRASRGRSELEIVAANDLAAIENIAYLLTFDSVYGRAHFGVEVGGGDSPALRLDGATLAYLSEPEPAKLPWGELKIDVVVESTGHFASYEKAKAHLAAGAKRVVITAPVKDDPAAAGVAGATVLLGINESELQTCTVSSNASCTTNAGSPVVAILHGALGIEKAVLNTVHGYTSSQSLVDAPNARDFRRGRAAAGNIIPASTGAALATTKALPELAGRFDGIALRVPVLAGSVADITFVSSRETSAEEVNEILRKASREARWKGIFTVTEDPIVSSDILGSPFASIADLSFTRVVGGTLVKVLAWYDNEMGYANTLVAHVIKAGEQLK